MIQEKLVYSSRSEWARGVWDDEPDRAEWEHEGFACLAVRHPTFGNWCGYLGVGPDHPLFGVPAAKAAKAGLKGHWGVNFAAPCDGGMICHTKRPGVPQEVWWFGFDCGHARDLAPAIEPIFLRAGHADDTPPELRREYRTLEYVREQVNEMARQAAGCRR